MNLLNRFNVQESSEFHKKGYFILKNSLTNLKLRGPKFFFEIKRNAKKGRSHLLVYDDYSALRNLSGIEMTFNEQILSQEIFNFIDKLNYLK